MTGAAAFAATLGSTPGVLTATAPTLCNGVDNHAPVTTESATVTITGGTAPYTVLWSQVGTSGKFWTIDTPTATTTTFTCQNVADHHVSNAVFHCVVTDSLGATATTNDVPANATATGEPL